ncbi:MAG: permease [Alphaproteobacteria bacterium]|nr:permease [Alphaproteobacteria bacterium]
MTGASSIPWLARHEFRLAWRDWWSMLTAGKRHRTRIVLIAMAAFAAFMHLIAFAIVAKFAEIAPDADRGTLVVITGCALLAWSLMMSQAMEAVTRAFYARSDFDLILSSPVAARRVFAVRIAALAVSTVVMALMLSAPFINVLIWRGGLRWLSAYGVVIAVGAAAAALSVALTVALFRTIGPKRTRLAAQIVAAIVGATFVIGLQVAAILSYGSLIPMTFLQSEAFIAMVPAIDSIAWWPARAMLGDMNALAAVALAGFGLLAAAIALFSARFGEHAVAAAGVSNAGVLQRRRTPHFRNASARTVLRRKEWTLLRRDPWLASQTLMQLLYLLPPALLLWQSFGHSNDDLVLLVPVLVMAAGQLSGGLAWLAISGEDAPDLVATAPVPARWIVRAKIEAVVASVAMVFAPFVLILALVAPRDALAAAAGVAIATVSSTMIQLWFRTQAKRKHFRRRQTSSRFATFAEALSSIAWAATAGLAAAGRWQAAITAALALGILATARAISPQRKDEAA